MGTQTVPILSCRDVELAYNGIPVISDVNFEVEQGDYLCIVGENGTGKTTLMKGILGLVKPTKGSFQFDQVKPTEIGYLPQQTVVQKDFPASVMEVVLSGCLNHTGVLPFYSKQDKERAIENMRKLGIEEIRKKSYRALSGGQQQRVLLARALCATEKLLFLDEPVNRLDPVMSADMYALIKKLNQEHGITVIMISHDMSHAVEYGNKILHLHKKPLFYGYTEDYKKTDICRRMMGGAYDV